MKYDSKIVDLNHLELSELYFMGDIHGNFLSIDYKLKQHDSKNTLVVVCGDIGIGFSSSKYEEISFQKLQNKLEENNNYVIFLRGNHDNPEYFSNPERFSLKLKNEYPNIILVDDYDIIKCLYGNILCIGGARSIDKIYRNDPASYSFGTWFEGEYIKDLPDNFDDYCDCNIDIIASHCAPVGVMPVDKGILLQWNQLDNTIIPDCDAERELLRTILVKLKEKGHNIKDWYYGHFHLSANSYIYDINFRALNIGECWSH